MGISCQANGQNLALQRCSIVQKSDRYNIIQSGVVAERQPMLKNADFMYKTFGSTRVSWYGPRAYEQKTF